MKKWQEFLAQVEKRLNEKGLKAAAASRLAVGNPFLIYNLRKGHKPSVENLERLCKVLDLNYSIDGEDEKSEQTPPLKFTSEDAEEAAPGLAPVKDRQLAEVLAIIADHYEAENEYGRNSFLADLKAWRPALFAGARAAPRRVIGWLGWQVVPAAAARRPAKGS